MKGTNQSRGAWTPAEDALLVEFYPIGGARLVQEKTGRTHAACRSRAAFFPVESPYSAARAKGGTIPPRKRRSYRSSESC